LWLFLEFCSFWAAGGNPPAHKDWYFLEVYAITITALRVAFIKEFIL